MKRLSLCAMLLAVSVSSAQEKSVPPRTGNSLSESQADSKTLVPLPRVVPSPKDNPTTPAKVELGKMLFFDPRLSGDNKMSCATCHIPEKAYADGLVLSPGKAGKLLARNTQTCLNVGFFNRFFWDGRAGGLEEQALGPIQSSVEMNQNLNDEAKQERHR